MKKSSAAKCQTLPRRVHLHRDITHLGKLKNSEKHCVVRSLGISFCKLIRHRSSFCVIVWCVCVLNTFKLLCSAIGWTSCGTREQKKTATRKEKKHFILFLLSCRRSYTYTQEVEGTTVPYVLALSHGDAACYVAPWARYLCVRIVGQYGYHRSRTAMTVPCRRYEFFFRFLCVFAQIIDHCVSVKAV